MTTPARLSRSQTWGTTANPVRTNQHPTTGQLLVNGPPDGWELGPILGQIADDGQPPAWWIGTATEDGWSPIGPHGPFAHSSWARAVVIRATELICDPLVSDPFKVMQSGLVDVPRGQAVDPPRWITDPQLLRADSRVGPSTVPHHRRLARSTFYREWVRDALWHGMGHILCDTAADGQPLAGTMRLVPPHAVHVDTDTDRWWLNDPRRDPAAALPFDSDGRLPNGLKLITLRNPHSPVDDYGRTRGVFALNPDTFMAAWMVDQYLAGAFRSGVPNGYLKVTQPQPLTQDQADDLKRRWLGAHGKRRSIAVLNAATEFVPLTWSPVDADVQEMKRLAMADVAFAFGIAPEVLGISLGLSGTYSNIKDWWRLHRDFSLSGWIDQIGGVLSAQLPTGTNVTVNLDAHTRPDLTDRVQIMAAAAGADGVDLEAMADLLDLPYRTPTAAPEGAADAPA